jgi:protein-tyrosine phosphatase
MRKFHRLAAGLTIALAIVCPALASAKIEAPVVERVAPGRLEVRWQGDDPVDVYVATRPDASIKQARLLVRVDHAGLYELPDPGRTRPYFILRDERDGDVVHVAERLLPLEQGSNFRDVGGYPAAGGKHIRWGMIYRSGATPLLTAADNRYVRQLGITSIVDLRSVEERQIAPDDLAVRLHARYLANDYPASQVFPQVDAKGAPIPNPNAVSPYRTWPTSLAPQYRALFRQLLDDKGAVNVHCSAGQDRSGVATALVLSALGVPRSVIFEDYNLSTEDRRPEFEMPRIDPAAYPGNPVAAYYGRMQASHSLKAKPLIDAAGKPYLQQTFDEIDARWGSVEAYLDQVLGVDHQAIERLRSIYLQ